MNPSDSHNSQSNQAQTTLVFMWEIQSLGKFIVLFKSSSQYWAEWEPAITLDTRVFVRVSMAVQEGIHRNKGEDVANRCCSLASLSALRCWIPAHQLLTDCLQMLLYSSIIPVGLTVESVIHIRITFNHLLQDSFCLCFIASKRQKNKFNYAIRDMKLQHLTLNSIDVFSLYSIIILDHLLNCNSSLHKVFLVWQIIKSAITAVKLLVK